MVEALDWYLEPLVEALEPLVEALEPMLVASTALNARPGTPRVEVLALLLEHFVAHHYQGE